jgi:hypothetical protein
MGFLVFIPKWLTLKHKGTAVVVGYVTGEASQILVPVVSSEAVPVASQYAVPRRAQRYGGAIFAPGLTERSERKVSRCARAITIAAQVGSC